MSGQGHEFFMGKALELARQAADSGEVPVGAVVVRGREVIGRGMNSREKSQDPAAHAEMAAIKEASEHLGSWRLEKTALYVTMEPCPMCAGAIINARIPMVIYGCDDPKAGAVQSLYTLLEDTRLNHRAQVVPGVRAQEASELLRSFFAELRRRA